MNIFEGFIGLDEVSCPNFMVQNMLQFYGPKHAFLNLLLSYYLL